MSAKHPSSPTDRFWHALVEVETPSVAEMAAEERELRALEGVAERLPKVAVERCVAHATRPAARGAFVARLLAGGGQRRLLLSAVLMVAAAWVALDLIWPEQQHAWADVNYPQAVELATEPFRDDLAYKSAIGIIVSHADHCADVLNHLRAQTAEPGLAHQAQQLAGELVVLLTNGPVAASGPVDLTFLASAAAALDPKLPADQRARALAHLGDLTKSGITAMLLSPLVGQEARENRAIGVASILRTLGG